MKKILVTGATGYVGGRLVSELVSRGYQVRVLARGAERLSGHSWINRVEVVDGDAQSRDVLSKALDRKSTRLNSSHT